jgi:hypothetical protein
MKDMAYLPAGICQNFCSFTYFYLESGVPNSGLGVHITVQSRNEFPYYRAGHCRFRQAEGRFATAPEQRSALVSPDRSLDAPRFVRRAGMVGFRLSCFLPSRRVPVTQLSVVLRACPLRLTCD